jgi:hypothetical protein
MLLLVTLIPVAAANSANLGNDIGQGQLPPNTSVEILGNPELARCQGAKCAGRGDTIRNGQDMDTAEQLAGNRGGQSTSGTKKGARNHDDLYPANASFLALSLAGNGEVLRQQ